VGRPRWAAVAVVHCASDLLLVRRASREGDPWSGDWAFPGGFGHPEDPDPAATARRETAEELGLALGEPMGELPRRWIVDPWRRRLVALVPVLFRVEIAPALAPAPDEIAEARWVPWSTLADPARRRREWLWIRGRIPWWADLRLLDDGRIWGLTGAILDDLARRSSP
jgi:8-oxo-dGTP pyrophosphatase MutT (NUDIX family)